MTNTKMGFELRVAGLPAGSVRIAALTLREGVNQLYEARIRLLCDADLALEEHAPGRAAMVEMSLAGDGVERRRMFHGIVRSAQSHGLRPHHGVERPLVEGSVTLVPRLWLLSRRSGSRIFQRLSVDQIIRTVLAEHHVASQWRLERTYPVREYCTQFEETDLAFVTRLAAEAGMFFYFEQPGDELDPLSSAARELTALAFGAADSGLSSLTSAASSAAGGLGAASGLANAAIGAAGDLAGAALGKLGGASGLPREIVVFADAARAYPPLNRGEPQSFEQLATQAGVDLGRAAIGQVGAAVGDAIGGAIGGGAGSAVGDLVESGVRAGFDVALGAAGAGGDAPAIYVRNPGDALALGDELALYAPSREREVMAKRFTYREFDPRRPNAELGASRWLAPNGQGAMEGFARITGEAGLAAGAIGAAANQLAGDALGAANALGAQALGARAVDAIAGGAGLTQPFERYEHHSNFLFPNWEYEREEVERMLRSELRDEDRLRAASPCPWMEAGRRFGLVEHGLGHFNIEYVVVEVTHRVELQAVDRPTPYSNEVVCVPAVRPYVPVRPPRRNVQSCMTATVQAADDTTIHTDPGAHVRVQFHWDRGQPGAGYNSCWIRVMQPWAGAGYGALFIPRAGTEVVVVFEGGDPDRPLVIGCVYNGANPPPFVLPAQKTRSGFKTQTTPGVEGANELWFDDASGREQIYLHAQRDYTLDVEHDRRVHVVHDETLHVEGDRRTKVDGTHDEEVVGRGESRYEDDRVVRVAGNRQTTVEHDDSRQVAGSEQVRVGGSRRDEVLGGMSSSTGGDMVMRVGGNLTQIVGSDGAPRSLTTHVEGRVATSATKTLRLVADQAIELVCGGTVLRLMPEKLELVSKELVLQGDGARLRLTSKEARIQADVKVQAVSEEVVLKGSGAAVGLKTEAAVDGSRILLNSPQSANDSVESSDEQPTIIELTDPDGNPIPNAPYRVVLGDGSEMSGNLDENGRAELLIEGSAQVTFPGLTEVEAQ